jgi:hypothetical protein
MNKIKCLKCNGENLYTEEEFKEHCRKVHDIRHPKVVSFRAKVEKL